MEDGISTVRSWTSGTQNVIQSQSLFTHVLSNIVGDLDSKSSKGQDGMVE